MRIQPKTIHFWLTYFFFFANFGNFARLAILVFEQGQPDRRGGGAGAAPLRGGPHHRGAPMDRGRAADSCLL